MSNLQIKQKLHNKLIDQLDEKITDIQKAMFETSESMKNDTKSSAGDKFETGREMIQQELNNQQAQLDKLFTHKKDLSRIDLNVAHHQIGFGTLVTASNGNYYISAALGKVELDGTDYYALSLASPVGTVLQSAKKGDKITFQNREISILQLA